ncbi:hypothetical protein [Hyalangium minutum]|uniref:hypothetical protein n=1 Tax=Hyalangium minutum TaxID=394096 RepID=UPI000A077BCD|nr:hypothetical protein [Hyalangium minutum]
MNRFAVTMLVVTLSAGVCEALGSSPPGYSVQITRAGLDPLINGIANLSEAYAKKSPAPDATMDISNVHLIFKGMSISTLERPAFVYTLQAPNKLLTKVTLPKVIIKGLFQASRRTQFETQEDQGNVDFTLVNATLTQSVTLGTFENGILRVDQRDCKATLGSTNVAIQNNQQSFSADAVRAAAPAERQLLATNLCNVLTQLLTKKVDRALAQLPSVLSFSNNVSLKGQLTPAFTVDSVKVNFSEESITGFASAWAPVLCDTSVAGSPQAILTVSDVTFNKLLYLDYKSGLLNFTLSPSSAPILYQKITLDCGESGVCLGNVDKKLPERFGKDAKVELQMEAPMASTLEFKESSTAMTASWRATVYITKNQEGAPRTLVASGAVSASGPLQANIQGEKAYGRVNIAELKLKVDQPEVQSWDQDAQSLFKDIVQTYINDFFLKDGLSLPSGLSVENASIKFSPHCGKAPFSLDYTGILSSEE